MTIVQKLELPEGIQSVAVEFKTLTDGFHYNYYVKIVADSSLYDQLVEADELLFTDEYGYKSNMYLSWCEISSSGVLEAFYVTKHP